MKAIRKYLIPLIVLCGALLFGTQLEMPNTDAPAAQPAAADAEAAIHFIDVGQGDAALIRAGGSAVLIDGGTQEAGDTVVDYLEQQGITRLDAVIASHPHEDHIGGLVDVFAACDVDAIYMSDIAMDTRIYEKLLDAIDAEGIVPQCPSIGDTIQLPDTDATLTVLAPGPDSDKTYGSDPNAWSLVVRLDAGGCSALFTGDTVRAVEEDMVQRSPALLDCDILKVTHHGSRTGSCPDFIDAALPDYAVISYAEGNSYGLPDEEIFDLLEPLGTQIFETAKDGTVVLTMDNGKVDVAA